MFTTYEPVSAAPDFTALYFVSSIAPGLKARSVVNGVPVYHSSLYVTTGPTLHGRRTFQVRRLDIEGDTRTDRQVILDLFNTLGAAKEAIDRCMAARSARFRR